jgi:hypothetical protein
MADFKLKYSGAEAVEMIKNYYPKNWYEILKSKKEALIKMSRIHKLPLTTVFRKFVIPGSSNQETIVFFAALYQLMETEKLTPANKKDEVLELEEKLKNIKNQLIALSTSKVISPSDKNILYGYYSKIQAETTCRISELLNSFPVIEPKLVIYQTGFFDTQSNS